MRKRGSRDTAARLLTVFLLLLTPALAAWTKLPHPNSTWTIEVSGGAMLPLGGRSPLAGKGATPGLDVELSDAAIVEADVGYQAADFLFLRMGLAAGRLDLSVENFGSPATGFESVRIGTADVQMLKAAALFHFPLPPGNSLLLQRLDHNVEMRLGIGPVMAFSRFSDATVSQEGRNKLGVTAITGRGDLSFGIEGAWLFFVRDSGWMVNLDVGAMLTKGGSIRVETGPASNYEPSTLTYRPLYIILGVGYRF